LPTDLQPLLSDFCVRATVIFDNFGPYHLARLRTTAQVCDLMAIEVAASSAEYAWTRRTDNRESRHLITTLSPVEAERERLTPNLKIVTLLERSTTRNVQQRELVQKLNQVLDDFRPQVVFIPGWSSKAAFSALLWCVRNNIPAVAMSESTEWDETRASWKEWVKRKLVGLCASALVGGTPHKDYMVQLGMPLERIFLGYDAVDNGYFAKKAEEVRSRKSESTSPDMQHNPHPVSDHPLQSNGRGASPRSGEGRLPENYFLASARFIEKKNLPGLIEAYARYRELALKSEVRSQKSGSTSPRPSPQSGEGVVPWDLVLLGDGELRPTLNSQLSTLNLQHSVRLPGFKQYPELPAYYGSAGVFIHASTTEQWGLVVNEAMASGLPVLVSNRCGCAIDLVKDGVNGFTFDPYNAEQLAQLMLKLSTLPSPPRSGRGLGEVSSFVSDPSSIIHHPSPTLAQMAQASQRIIADWGPQRFAEGLQAAADKAVKVGSKHASWFDRLLLRGLLLR
jgi:glycosyltransferase involved in cell wall biosynthesis